MANSNDLRYVRTEKAIRKAFMELLSEKPLNSVTVSALCRRAGISRNAFYLHHSGIAALYETMLSEVVEATRVSSRMTNRLLALEENTLEDVCEKSLRTLEPYLDTLRTFLSVDDGTLTIRLLDATEEGLVRNSIVIHGSKPDASRQLMLANFGYGLVGFLKAWLVRTDRSIDDVVDPFTRMNAASLYALGRYTADCMKRYGTPNAPTE